jgi:hypothetical protein
MSTARSRRRAGRSPGPLRWWLLPAVAIVLVGTGWLVFRLEHPPCRTDLASGSTCGVLWGVATDPNTRPQLQSVERELDRRFAIVYRFHDLDDAIPTADERALVADGRILHISIDPRIYAAPQLTLQLRDVADGRYDTDLIAQARGIAALHVPVFVTFGHEPDQPGRAAEGGPSEFIAAWRHVHDLFARAGAHNAVWVWVVTGYPPAFTSAGQLWPGNAFVDWISWEAYNTSGCRQSHTNPTQFQSFAAIALPFYRWLKQSGPALGISADKPMMLSEVGSVVYAADPALTASWYRQIPSVLAKYSRIRAVSLWDRPGNFDCDYRFDGVPAILDAVSGAVGS